MEQVWRVEIRLSDGTVILELYNSCEIVVC